MKKITVLLIAVLMFALCSCGNESKPSEVKDVAVQLDYM